MCPLLPHAAARIAGAAQDITAAAMRLCHDVGQKPDAEPALEQELASALHRISAPEGALDKAVLTELPVRLQARAPRPLPPLTSCRLRAARDALLSQQVLPCCLKWLVLLFERV